MLPGDVMVGPAALMPLITALMPLITALMPLIKYS